MRYIGSQIDEKLSCSEYTGHLVLFSDQTCTRKRDSCTRYPLASSLTDSSVKKKSLTDGLIRKKGLTDSLIRKRSKQQFNKKKVYPTV